MIVDFELVQTLSWEVKGFDFELFESFWKLNFFSLCEEIKDCHKKN